MGTPRRWGARRESMAERARETFDRVEKFVRSSLPPQETPVGPECAAEKLASALPPAESANRIVDGLEATAVFVDEWAELRADPGLRAKWLAERPASERLRVAVDAANGLVLNAERELRKVQELATPAEAVLAGVAEQLAAAVDELGAAQQIVSEISEEVAP